MSGVVSLGPLGVFLLMVPESACIPLPSEATLVAAGLAVREGWMPLWAAVASATAGNLVGSLIAYGLGRQAAGRRLPGWGQRGLDRCDALFARRGNLAVFVARLMPLARSFVSLPAGHARVAIGPFVLMTTLGCAIWATGFALLGLLAGGGWRTLGAPIADPLLAVGAVLALAALLRR